MLYKHYIFFFHGIDLVSICPRKSFNHSCNLVWILTATSGGCCNPGSQTAHGWYRRGWERSPTLPRSAIGSICNALYSWCVHKYCFSCWRQGLRASKGRPTHLLRHHHCDLSSLTRQRRAYLAALTSRSPALFSCPFLKLPHVTKKSSIVSPVTSTQAPVVGGLMSLAGQCHTDCAWR